MASPEYGAAGGTTQQPAIARRGKLRQSEGMIAWPVLVLYLYGILLIIGGLMGYVKAKSVPSAVAGLVCGLLAIFIGYDYTWHFAPYAAFILALILIFIMVRRYRLTGKPMPAAPIVVLSIVVALVQIYVILFVGLGHDPL